jgi:hypothetical protein
MFKNVDTSYTDEERLGGPSTFTAEENTERVDAMIRDNRLVIIGEVAYNLRISHDSAHEIIQDRLGYRIIKIL